MSITAGWPWLCKRGGDTLPLYRLSPSSERSDKPISFSGASHIMQTAPHTTCLLHTWSMKSTHTYGLNKPRCKCKHWVVVGGGHTPAHHLLISSNTLSRSAHTHTLTSRLYPAWGLIKTAVQKLSWFPEHRFTLSVSLSLGAPEPSRPAILSSPKMKL